ncbi:eukaryotic translation elongation factor 1 epsilon-1-like [Watersipora subatra]|uniref:eukaryotic translation elongation factor 1 epsilon-1-like n=1 Tax=Watersipora subatra TaxID=2589382 RepID=UPI00355B5798
MEEHCVLNKLLLDMASQLNLQQPILAAETAPSDGYTVELKKLLQHPDIHTCRSAVELALQRQWLELRLCSRIAPQSSAVILTNLNQSLSSRTFLASNKLTLVDVLWAFSVAPCLASLAFNERESFMNISRWLAQVSYQLKLSLPGSTKSKTLLYH